MAHEHKDLCVWECIQCCLTGLTKDNIEIMAHTYIHTVNLRFDLDFPRSHIYAIVVFPIYTCCTFVLMSRKWKSFSYCIVPLIRIHIHNVRSSVCLCSPKTILPVAAEQFIDRFLLFSISGTYNNNYWFGGVGSNYFMQWFSSSFAYDIR